MTEFLLGDEHVSVTLPADTTVLDYLREHRARTGTKEGCASGDCGACTVVVASASDDRLVYEPVNACIATVGSLHGKQLITVEQLRDEGNLHPVQQAMVDHHGSQCGFCTPGFIMSLFALYHRTGDISREAIIEGLGGNLCRCTGYRPIIDAAQEALTSDRSDSFNESENDALAALRAIQASAGDGTKASSAYLRPTSADDVAEAISQNPEARLIAGGTDLMLEVTQDLKPLPQLIDISAVPALAESGSDDESIRLGAAVTHNQSRAVVFADYPELAELIERFGSTQIRSRGTVAGNIANASPVGDWPPVMLALNGVLELCSSSGVRDVAADEFFLDYRKTAMRDDEFIQAVRIPRRADSLFLRAYKISKRYEDDISSVCLVVALNLDGDTIRTARIGCGGMAAIPKRATGCEKALEGINLLEDSLLSALDALDNDFAPIDDARATATYRSTVARNLLQRLQHEYRGEIPTRAHAAVIAHG